MSDPRQRGATALRRGHGLRIGRRILHYDAVDSTNSRVLALHGDGVVVAAEAQTAGRGRHGRSWHSAPGQGLWMSVGFDRAIDGLLFAAALAVRDTVRDALSGRGCAVSLKWPNDVLVDGRKASGMLIERRGGRTALGIGINVHQQRDDFPEELRDRAISLDMAAGRELSRWRLLRALITHLDRRIATVEAEGALGAWTEWAAACAIEGRRIRSGEEEGVAIRLDRTGAIILSTPSGVRTVAWGDVVEQHAF